ncbi:phosphonate C-P lyase system protein PhnL [Rhizobium sp. 1AS11]|uniref:phosphonate C-P lyase system protein PhnL n=1 Tax=Rhizobium acaciae TaxID=2989736 RepID=UPI0022214B27|nr:phosphonate C-P lyase system protein PhnL [Rhizobium acaciae]MCW1412986.1 phosphonate C-P lyase system protein PhnL [Rhizobium acaciae]MCW1745138.1 phosphonate C-P lyase system protein PhnL [Rhizobium acaciae]
MKCNNQPSVLHATGLSKSFTLHTQGGAVIPVFNDVSFDLGTGECLCLHGPSGAGKSTLLRALYANYKLDEGEVLILFNETIIDITKATHWEINELRRQAIGYVSQFLRVIPRVSTLEIVAGPLLDAGASEIEARAAAAAILERLRIPERLWSLAPATFSGGEQQRINIARGFVIDYPILLLDEPTASLDAANRATVVDLINDAKGRGTAVVGIFHDHEVRDAVCDRLFELAGPLVSHSTRGFSKCAAIV